MSVTLYNFDTVCLPPNGFQLRQYWDCRNRVGLINRLPIVDTCICMCLCVFPNANCSKLWGPNRWNPLEREQVCQCVARWVMGFGEYRIYVFLCSIHFYIHPFTLWLENCAKRKRLNRETNREMKPRKTGANQSNHHVSTQCWCRCSSSCKI